MPAVKVLKRTTIYQGRIIRLIREKLKAGGHTMIRETIRHPGAVVIVPILDPHRLVMVRQYRRAVGRQLLELPAGTLEPGEPRLACAKRELQEETGWKAKRWIRLGQFYAAPGFISEQLTIFLAAGLTKTKANPEPDEMVYPVIVSLDKALRQIESGTICDGKTIIGILFARKKLRQIFRRKPV